MVLPNRWARVLVVVGGLAGVVGTLDPLEGSVVIVVGCGLVTLGTSLGGHSKAMRTYWMVTLGLVVLGVAALWILSAMGGVGGNSGRSMWWLMTCLPYPAGWLMAFGGLVVRLVRAVTSRKRAAAVPA